LAPIDSTSRERLKAPNENQLRLMLQTLLAERFELVIHREANEMPAYHLVVAKSGAKLHEWGRRPHAYIRIGWSSEVYRPRRDPASG
jgi:uncharacterized protein (TIGR03435 family)